MATQIEIDGRPYRLDTGDTEMEQNLYEKVRLLQDGAAAAEEILAYDDDDYYVDADEEDEDDEDMEEMEDSYDSAQGRIDALEAELAVMYTLLDADDEEDEEEEDDEDMEEMEDSADYFDADDFEEAVADRVSAVLTAYQDAIDLLPRDFKLDGVTHPGHIQQAVLNYINPDISEQINFDSAGAVNAAYQMVRKLRRDTASGISPVATALSARADMGTPARVKPRRLTYSSRTN